MRKKLIAGNWKMNKNVGDARALLKQLLEVKIDTSNTDVVVIPPSIYLIEFTVQKKHGFSFGAQNCHHKPEGAFTGEISAPMLKSIGVEYCLVGHSERRQYFHEHDADCLAKIRSLLENKITPILCIGESLEVRELGKQNNFVEQQLSNSVLGLTANEMEKLVIAYEPVWAIGTGKTASVEQASEMHGFIREWLNIHYKTVADKIQLLYGGSVNENNAKELLHASNIDGVLVGGASLKADSFQSIIHSV